METEERTLETAEDSVVEPQVTGDLETEQPVETETEAVGEESVTPEEKDRKTRFQKRIDELVREREEAKEEAALWRSESQRLHRMQSGVETLPKVEVDMSDLPRPRREDYEDDDEFEYARNEWSAVKALRTEQTRERQQRDMQQRYEAEEQLESWKQAAVLKYPDFAAVVLRPDVAVTDQMAEALLTSEHGHDVAYYLGKNPQEAWRIAQLPARVQAVEIRKLASREANKPKPKTTSTAPTATSPVGDREVVTKKWDIYDKDIPFKEYEKIRMAQIKKRMEL